MRSAVAAVLAGGVTIAYVPVLRGQIRDGEIGIPFGTINPIRLRREEHPLAFRIGAVALSALIAMLLAACVLLLIRAAAA